MDLDFIERVQNIALTEEEGEEIKVGRIHKNKTLKECSISLLGRFLTSCPYNQIAAKSLLRSVWKMGFDLRIVDGLPFDLIYEEASKDISGGLGKVVEIDNKVYLSEQAHFVRIRLEIPLDKPLCQNAVVVNSEGDTVLVGFKYERLVGLYYQCGIIGHKAKECPSPKTRDHGELPYGEWLKADWKGSTT
nr:uncharacterized protein CFP56_64945 [Quercus suber]